MKREGGERSQKITDTLCWFCLGHPWSTCGRRDGFWEAWLMISPSLVGSEEGWLGVFLFFQEIILSQAHLLMRCRALLCNGGSVSRLRVFLFYRK